MDIKEHSSRLESLEKEIINKSAKIFVPGRSISACDLYLIGAANRTLAQSRGFRLMINERNFPCAAAILRTQIDTAMRVNGIQYLENFERDLRLILDGEKIFRQLKSKSGEKMTDKFLREKLEAEYEWIKRVYIETSDFVHLSFRHLFTSIISSDDEDQSVYFGITGCDQERGEGQYDEIYDAFFEVTKISGIKILAIMGAISKL